MQLGGEGVSGRRRGSLAGVALQGGPLGLEGIGRRQGLRGQGRGRGGLRGQGGRGPAVGPTPVEGYTPIGCLEGKGLLVGVAEGDTHSVLSRVILGRGVRLGLGLGRGVRLGLSG